MWQVWGPQMLAATGCAPQLLQPAWDYMRIRAFGMPAALMLMIAQAGLLHSFHMPLFVACSA